MKHTNLLKKKTVKKKLLNQKKSTSKFEVARIGNKEYSTLAGFKRGLKSNHCPYEVDRDGLFLGRLRRRQWNYGSRKLEANVQLMD